LGQKKKINKSGKSRRQQTFLILCSFVFLRSSFLLFFSFLVREVGFLGIAFGFGMPLHFRVIKTLNEKLYCVMDLN